MDDLRLCLDLIEQMKEILSRRIDHQPYHSIKSHLDDVDEIISRQLYLREREAICRIQQGRSVWPGEAQ